MLTPNEIGEVIRQRGRGWWGKYAQLPADATKWLERTEKGLALYTVGNYPRVADLEQLCGVKEEENQTLRVVTTEHLDRYNDRMIMAGGTAEDYNGVVLDSHNLSTVKNILGSCSGLYNYVGTDGVPGIAGMTDYGLQSEENKEIWALDKAGKIPSQSIGCFVKTFHDEKTEEDGPMVQVIDTWSIYEYSKCAAPVNPHASTRVKALWEQTLRDAVKENLIKSDGALVRALTQSAKRLYGGAASTKLSPEIHRSAVTITRVTKTPAPAVPAPTSSRAKQVFDSELNNLLKQFSITHSHLPMDKAIEKLLAEMPGLSDEQKAYLAEKAGAEFSARNKAKHDALHAKLTEGMEHHATALKAYALGDESADKAIACHEAALAIAKELAEGKDDDEPAADAKPKGDAPADEPDGDEKSLRERIKAEAKKKATQVTVESLQAKIAELEKRVPAAAPAAPKVPAPVKFD